MHALLQLGWQPGGEQPLTAESDLRFCERNLFKSKEYWTALMYHEVVFDTGMEAFPHYKPPGYYMCVLKLNDAAFKAMLARPDLDQLRQVDFLMLAKGRHVPLFPQASLEPIADIERDTDFPDAPAPLPPATAMATTVHVPRLRHSVKMVQDTVYLDGWSHSSGQRRAYILCGSTQHAEGARNLCDKYRQLCQFDTQERCFAWLYAWKHGGNTQANRLCHRWYIPPEAEVDSVMQRFFT